MTVARDEMKMGEGEIKLDTRVGLVREAKG